MSLYQINVRSISPGRDMLRDTVLYDAKKVACIMVCTWFALPPTYLVAGGGSHQRKLATPD